MNMKYTIETIIEKPREEVIRKLDNVENLKHWQRGLVSAEHISGVPGEIGAKMKLNYKMGKREVDLIETIIKSEFPNEFHATYDAKGMRSVQHNYFEETPEGHTKWINKNEFEPEGFMIRLMAFLMPGAFKKQSSQYLNDFKKFAETGSSVAEN